MIAQSRPLHPSDAGRPWRALRHWSGHIILALGLICATVGMGLPLLICAGLVDPVGVL